MDRKGIDINFRTLVMILITIILITLVWVAVSEAKNRIFG